MSPLYSYLHGISQFCFCCLRFCHTYFFILFDRQPVRQGLGSHLQINADALCDELTANLIKLEKVTSYDIMQMLLTLTRFLLNFYSLLF